MTNRRLMGPWLLFGLLLGLALVGRWLQPAWNCTPLAAVAVMGGLLFANWRWAVLLPVTALTLGNLLLPTYGSLAQLLAVYACWILPVVLGRWLRRQETGSRLIACGLLPAICFYLVTNFVVWCDGRTYSTTWTGLLECYTAALPFFRTMLAGDLCYLALCYGCLAVWRTPSFAMRLRASI